MLHLEDGIGMKKVGMITRARVVELSGKEVYVNCRRKKQVFEPHL